MVIEIKLPYLIQNQPLGTGWQNMKGINISSTFHCSGLRHQSGKPEVVGS